MKRIVLLAGIAAGALSLAGCADGPYGGGYGGGGISIGVGNYWDQGPYAYDGYYDDYYGNIYDGYWGGDGAFYYRNSGYDRAYHRGDGDHFRHDGDGGGQWQHIQGNMNRPDAGTRMPHFDYRGGHGGYGGRGGDHGDHGGRGDYNRR